MQNFKSLLQHIHSIAINNHIIVANGAFPKRKYLRELIANAHTLIACDGAIHNLLKYEYVPNYIIGDCDSLSLELRQIYAKQVIVGHDQNTNDLTKAMQFVLKKLKLNTIIILGATGLREDHTLANIALLAYYYNLMGKDKVGTSEDGTKLFSASRLAMISDYGIFTVHCGKTVLKTIKGQQISLFSPDINNRITCHELKWPLDNYQLTNLYSGTLNEATADQLYITSTHPVIVYRLFAV